MRNKTTAALIAFFLGGFGGQFFYLGKTMLGLVCLVFCWTFIPALIALYHTIKFLTMTDEAFNTEYNNGMQATYSTGGGSTADELAKLHKLKEIGAINEQEYEARKARLLA
jgi:TM2 domain-containing membrane protein YozV